MYQKAVRAVQIKTSSPLPRVGFLRSEHRPRRGRADIGARWSARRRVWDAVFLRRQMRDLGRVGSELRNSSPRFLKGALSRQIRMQNAAGKAEGERAGEPRTPRRARFGRPSADRVPRFPGLAYPDTHPSPGPPRRAGSFPRGSECREPAVSPQPLRLCVSGLAGMEDHRSPGPV